MSWQTVFKSDFTRLDNSFRLYFPKSINKIFNCEEVVFKIDFDKPNLLGIKIPTKQELKESIKPLTAKVTKINGRGVRIAIPEKLVEHLCITAERHAGHKFETSFSKLSEESNETDFITINFSSSE